MLSHKILQPGLVLNSPTWNTFQVQASWRFNPQEVFGHSALSCHQAVDVSCAGVFLSTEAAGWRIRVSPHPPPLPDCQSDYPGSSLVPGRPSPPLASPPLTISSPPIHALTLWNVQSVNLHPVGPHICSVRAASPTPPTLKNINKDLSNV